jgi:predicted transcriptional regulator
MVVIEIMSWDDVSLVLASTYRRKVLEALKQSPRTPSMIARETSLHIEHVSRALHELAERQLVENLTPRRRRGTLYSLTSRGSEVLQKVSESF